MTRLTEHLIDKYRTWWAENFNTMPNAQACVLAAAFAAYVLKEMEENSADS